MLSYSKYVSTYVCVDLWMYVPGTRIQSQKPVNTLRAHGPVALTVT